MNEKELIKILQQALSDAQDHLDFCGYGDRYEAECAREHGLEKQIVEALSKARDYLQ